MYRIVCQIAVLGLIAPPVLALDFGKMREQMLREKSLVLFGIEKPLEKSAVSSTKKGYRKPDQRALDQVAVAPGLKVEYLTRKAADRTDMMAFFPAQSPTHLITCVEVNRRKIDSDRYNPAVQRISLKDGRVDTILRGMSRCDGIRRTPWGTILATEEASDGGAYEILDPLTLTNATVLDRTKGLTSHPKRVAKRTALPRLAWEGLTVLASGVVINDDELRPGSTGRGSAGGAIYKFVPVNPHSGGSIRQLDQSPLVAGRVYTLQVRCKKRKTFGQGCEVGNGTWIQVNPDVARKDSQRKGGTGYYRPEDLHKDPTYKDKGVRFCWANTGKKGLQNFGEVVCAIDKTPLMADPKKSTVTVSRFIEGDLEFNQPDNLDFQPGTGILYVSEDNDNGDIWACLPDGKDRDLKSDGCVRVLSVRDSSAEPTGFIFDSTGTTAYLTIQHSNDDAMTKIDGNRTDDIVKITGFKKIDDHRKN